MENFLQAKNFLTNFLLICLTIQSLLCAEESLRLGSKKNKLVLNELTDVKDWKKLIKSKTNVLICFGSGKASFTTNDDLLVVLKQSAELIKGLGTIAIVDCTSSGDTKKLCKKVKANPTSGKYVMKHYHNGEFNKDYDRALKVSSVVNFLQDPTGDLPWNEDESAEDVVHLPDLQALQKLVKKESGSKGILVLFFAPWCGYCKKMKPDYVSAAKELKEDGILAALDCNRPENGVVRQKYNITGFPTLLYFRNGVMKQQFEGENNKDGIVSFMRDPNAPKLEKPKEPEWSDEPSEVVHLTTDTFDKFVKENPSVICLFYAPWCGHCKKMKPGYASAAEKLKQQKIVGVLAAVDVTKEPTLGSRFDVKGYPTVKYFKEGEMAFDLGNIREEAAIIDFMKNPEEPPPPPPAERMWSEEESYVVHLNEENFKSTLRKKKRALVIFYAPWCGHCKSAKPEFNAAAEELKNEPRVLYGAVDCTVEKALCETYEVRGFPTFKVFQYFNKEDVLNYEGDRKKSGFVAELRLGSGDTPTQKQEIPPEDDWTEIPGHDKVHILTDATAEKFLSSHEFSLIMFYAPWCQHCKSAKPDFSQAAASLAKEDIPGVLAAVDCTRSQKTCQKYSVSGYPTFQFFKNGKFSSDYNDGRKTNEFIQFMKQKTKAHEEL